MQEDAAVGAAYFDPAVRNRTAKIVDFFLKYLTGGWPAGSLPMLLLLLLMMMMMILCDCFSDCWQARWRRHGLPLLIESKAYGFQPARLAAHSPQPPAHKRLRARDPCPAFPGDILIKHFPPPPSYRMQCRRSASGCG